jgi:translation elongation factor EF-1beta
MGGTVGVLFKVYPEEEQDAEELAKRIKSELGAAGVSFDEIGFGIKIVKAFFKFEDKATTSMEIEEKLKKVKGVSEVEVMEESLL